MDTLFRKYVASIENREEKSDQPNVEQLDEEPVWFKTFCDLQNRLFDKFYGMPYKELEKGSDLPDKDKEKEFEKVQFMNMLKQINL